MSPRHCEHCPFNGTGTTCPRYPSNHARYCEWVDPQSTAFRPDGAEALRRIAAARGAIVPPASPPPRTVPVAESIRRLALVRACPDRADPQCGCAGMATCLKGKGRGGQVSFTECVECAASPA